MATIQDLTPLIGVLCGFNVAFGVWDNFSKRLVTFLKRSGFPMGGVGVVACYDYSEGVSSTDSTDIGAAYMVMKRTAIQFGKTINLGQDMCLIFAAVCVPILVYAGFDPKYELHLWSVIPLCPVLVAPIIATMVLAALRGSRLVPPEKWD